MKLFQAITQNQKVFIFITAPSMERAVELANEKAADEDLLYIFGESDMMDMEVEIGPNQPETVIEYIQIS